MKRSDRNITAASILLRGCLGLTAAIAAGLSAGPLTSVAWCQTLPNSDGKLDYGLEGLGIPPLPRNNATTPRTVQLLGEALAKARDTAIRVQFIQEIGLCRLPQSLSLVKPLLVDAEPLIRAQTCCTIESLTNSKETPDSLRQAIQQDANLAVTLQKILAEDADSRCRIAALKALVAIQGPDSPSISAAVAPRPTPDAALVACAIEMAGRPAHLEMIQRLWPSLPESSRLIAARTVGRIGDPKGAELVLPLLKSDVPARMAALDALGAMKATSHVALVTAAITDPHPSVRRAAVAALQAVATPDARRRDGLTMLKDSDPTVRQAAVQLLGANITPQLAKPIATQLADPYAPLYAAALKTLSTSADPAVRQACIDVAAGLLDSADPRRQQDGSYILGRYRSDAALERHLEVAATFQKPAPDWDLIAQAAESLGRIGRPDAKPVMVKLAGLKTGVARTPESQNSQAIANAMIACARLGEKAVLPACHRAIGGNAETMPSILRTGAVFAIGVVGTVADTRAFPSVMGGLYETPETRVEVSRAIGNLRDTAHLGVVQSAGSVTIEEQWMAHWAQDRIAGKTTPFVPIPGAWYADVSITDQAGQP